MAMEYFCFYHSYRKTLRRLSDSEVGRLVRALVEYSETGQEQELNGREQMAFDFIATDIDRAKENYYAKCDKNRENGEKGGRPKKPDGLEKTEKTERFLEKPKKPKEKEKAKEKAKEKEKISPPLPPSLGGCGPELNAVFSDWLAYKAEKRQAYKPTGLKTLIAQVEAAAKEYGEDAVAALIRECMASNWQGIIFDRLKKKGQAKGREGNVFLEMLEDSRQ